MSLTSRPRAAMSLRSTRGTSSPSEARTRGGEPPGRRLMRAYAAATQTVSLVLDEDAPLPDTDRDVDDLVHRLRGHVLQLGPAVPGSSPALRHAQQMSICPTPGGYVLSRVHLVRLAEAVGQLVETARLSGQASSAGPVQARWRRPSRNAVRLAVFALALGTVIIGGSAPRDAVTQTTTGSTVWLSVIVSTLALLIALALRPSPPRPRGDTGEGHLAIGELTQPDCGLGQDAHDSPARPSTDACAHYRERALPLADDERGAQRRAPADVAGERPH